MYIISYDTQRCYLLHAGSLRRTAAGNDGVRSGAVAAGWAVAGAGDVCGGAAVVEAAAARGPRRLQSNASVTDGV